MILLGSQFQLSVKIVLNVVGAIFRSLSPVFITMGLFLSVLSRRYKISRVQYLNCLRKRRKKPGLGDIDWRKAEL